MLVKALIFTNLQVTNLQVLDSALNELLLSKDWDDWLEELKYFCQHKKDNMNEFLGKYQAYRLAGRAMLEQGGLVVSHDLL